MTERTGGSDVVAERDRRAEGRRQWRLYGTKWFTSATTSEMALTLARPEGNPDGSRGLALFHVELRDANGRLRNIQVNRLKDKLGTRKVPTAELTLDGTPATLVGAAGDGVRAITPMLSVTRTWNAVCAVAAMRRGLALARDFARRRKAFGALLVDKPLHADTLAGLEAEYAGAFCLAFRSVALLGALEHGRSEADERARARARADREADDRQAGGRRRVRGDRVRAAAPATSRTPACRGSSRDAQVLPIWEGTTNVLSLDTLRALGKGGALEAVAAEVETQRREREAIPGSPGRPRPRAAAVRHAVAWVQEAMSQPQRLEAGARRFAMTLGRSLELALLVGHAQWCLDHGHGPRTAAAARRFATNGVDLITDTAVDDSALLA